VRQRDAQYGFGVPIRLRRTLFIRRERIRTGAAIYSRNCSLCHGSRMQNPESAFDLRKFPPDRHERFVSSVTRGKNQMPPWGDLLSATDVEALWAYVMAGEPR